MPTQWTFGYEPTDSLPPLAWIAVVRHPRVQVLCGTSVRRTDSAFFEGTWVGGEALDSVVDSTTTFGSGMVARGGDLFVVPPGHTMEGVYLWRGDGELLVSNTLVGLLAAADLELLPDEDYVSRFIRTADGLNANPVALPTSGGDVDLYFFENLLLGPDGRVSLVPKRREAPFATYDDYVARLNDALASCIANAPGYEPVISMSAGYDSTAMAVVSAAHGCRRALTFTHARPVLMSRDTFDSGEPVARRLGMEVEVFNREAYLERDDMPEAEFLATGNSGEDVSMITMERHLERTMLINGMVGNAMWRFGRWPRRDLWRTDLSGCSMTEFRLRLDSIYLPLPAFGMTEIPSLQTITQSAEMRPWSVGGYYDEPIARRIAEDAGIARGSFATFKRAATAVIHLWGREGMSQSSLASAEAFAASEGRDLRLRPRPRLQRRQRLFIKLAHLFRMDRLVVPIQRQRRGLIHFEPHAGSLLFRWGVARVRPRYEAARGFLDRGAVSRETQRPA